MPQRSKCDSLPEDIRHNLNEKLVSSAFSNYCELSDWLTSLGYSISKSSIHRYGQEFKEQLENIQIATEQAKAIAEVCEDDANLLGDALNRLAQQKAFTLLQEVDPDPNEASFTKLLAAISQLNRSTTDNKKHIRETKAKIKATAKEVEKTAKAGGLTSETVDEIKRKILGIQE